MADRMRQVDRNRRKKQRMAASGAASRRKKRQAPQRPVFDQQAAPLEQPRRVRSDGMQQIILPLGNPVPEAENRAREQRSGRKKRRQFTRKEQRRRKARRRLLFAALILLIAAAGVILSGNVLFKVDGYRITDTEGADPPNTGIYSEDAILAALNVHLGDNIYGFDPEQKAQTMEQAMPYLESVKIRRRLPGTIVIQVEAAVPKYKIQGEFGWAQLSSRLKVLAVQADPFEEDLTEIKLPVATPVVGQYLQIAEVPAAALGDSFTQSESSESSVSSEESASSQELSQEEIEKALQEATIEMQNTFDELISLLDKESLLDGVTCIDMENLQEISFSYQDRLQILLGTGNNLEYKMQLTGVIVRNDDGNCLTDSDRGTLDVSYVKKDGTIEPVFRSENDIDITGAVNGSQKPEEDSSDENTEETDPAEGDAAPAEE